MSHASLVIGSGSYLPGEPVSNAALAERLAVEGVETSDDWIIERTGIRQRYLSDGETTSQLATKAARQALDDAGVSAQNVDLIIVATSTPDWIFPSTACLVQKELDMPGAAAFDVQAVCSGFAYAVATADAMIRAGTASTAVVIGAETFSGIMDWTDRTTCVLFGDGAGAIVMTAGNAAHGDRGVLASRLHADGRHESILRTPGSVAGGQVTGHPFLTMDGKAVFKLAVGVLDSVGREVLEVAGKQVSELDWLIPHQANVRILNATAKKLGIDPEKVIVTVDQHANTSAASVPLAFDVARRDGRIKEGQLIMFQGVGGGFTWGANLVQL
ncbi:MAG: beta-ketoacyl-ACP synthase III [Burkholderiaceae bacterium]